MIDADRVREAERIDGRLRYENQILMTRLAAVLQLNGLSTVAAALAGKPIASTLALLFMVLDALWLYSSIDSLRFIRALHRHPGLDYAVLPDEKLWTDTVVPRTMRMPPVAFMVLVVPAALIIVWGAILFFSTDFHVVRGVKASPESSALPSKTPSMPGTPPSPQVAPREDASPHE